MSHVLYSDSTLTTDDVLQVIKLVNDWKSLSYGDISTLIIHSSQLEYIQDNFSTKKEISTECATHYVHGNPYSSWTHLAQGLYSRGEFAAVEKLKPFLPLRGKYQVISYAGMNHALHASTVFVFRDGLHNVHQKLCYDHS